MLAVVVFGVGGSTLYLLIFNRRTRQGLHDLSVGCYVIKAGGTGPVKTEPIWDTHWRVLRWFLTLLVILAISAIVMRNKLEKPGSVFQSEEDIRLLQQMGGVQMARVRYLKPLRLNAAVGESSLAHKKTLIVTVWWTGERTGREGFADNVARLILQNDPMVKDQDALWIVVARGYYLGIASGGESRTFAHTPAEWRERLLGSSTVPPPHR